MANEVRLINYDAAIDRYYAEYEKQDIYDGADDRDWLKKCFDEAPTIDPESLRPKGRWGVHRESEISKTVYCTNCWKDFYIHRKGELQIDTQPYCPNCGAKMEG